MCENCDRTAVALENIRRDLAITNALLARLLDHFGVPSPDGDSAVVRLLKSWLKEVESLDSPDAESDKAF